MQSAQDMLHEAPTRDQTRLYTVPVSDLVNGIISYGSGWFYISYEID